MYIYGKDKELSDKKWRSYKKYAIINDSIWSDIPTLLLTV